MCLSKILLPSSHTLSIFFLLFRSPPSSQNWTPCWTSTANSCTKAPRPSTCPPCRSCSSTTTSAVAPMSWAGTLHPLKTPTQSALVVVGWVTLSVAIPGGACVSSWHLPMMTTRPRTLHHLHTLRRPPRSPRHRCCHPRAPYHHITFTPPDGPTSLT